MKNIFVKYFMLQVILACFFIALHAQTIGLLKDINTSKDANPSVNNPFVRGNRFAVVGKTAYFMADDGVHGQELWRYDTSNGGTAKMVKDITPGAGSTYMRDFIATGNRLYFSSNNDELWVSDGTAAGTMSLGQATSFTFLAIGNTLYFTKGFNPNEIWKTDGTPAGTVLVATINTAQLNYANGIGQLTWYNGNIYFTTYYNNVYGDELWKTNGTQAGTVLVKDINPGAANSYPQNLTVVNGKLYFSAVDSTGSHLWVTDGTAAGTKKVKNSVNCSVDNSADFFNVIYVTFYAPPPVAVVNNILYFRGYTADKGWELCSYNTADTASGIVVAADINSGTGDASPANLTTVNNTLYFTAFNAAGHQRLYKNNGTPKGATMVKDIDPSGGIHTYFSNFINANGTLYFSGYAKATGYELWKSDGTGAGTVMVKDIFAGSYNSSNPDNVTYVAGSIVVFSAFDGVNGRELWRTDGTTAGTAIVKNINKTTTASSYPTLYLGSATFNGKTYFDATDPVYGTELYASDGTTAGTKMIKNIENGNLSSSPSNFTVFKNALYFLAMQNDTIRLFKSDGTTTGTTFFYSFPGNTYSTVASTDSSLYIINYNYTDTTSTIWKTDGTAGGTAIVKIIAGNTNIYDGPASTRASIGNTLYFVLNEKTHGSELWKTNGTNAGTVMVKDIYTGAAGSNPGTLYPYKGKVYFGANDSTGAGFFVTDGTAAGTKLVKRLRLYPYTRDSIINTLNGKMMFSAYTDLTGQELYTSDGTAAGTKLVKDIYPGIYGSNPDNFTIADTIMYFTAMNPKNGSTAVWRTNGKASGTRLVNQDPNSTSSFLYPAPQDLIFLNHKLYFADIDSTHTYKLWASDGTLAGTKVIGINGVTGFDYGITSINGKLLISCGGYGYGNELYGGVPPSFMKNSSLALQGRLSDNNGLLNWYTTGDAGSAYIVQRSVNGSQFSNIGTVNSGSADGFAQSSFNYTDNNITSLGVPAIHYRLQQITTDGDTANSKIVTLNINSKLKASVYPNPVVGNATLQVSGAGKAAMITITNITGKTVWHGIAESDRNMVLPLAGLPAGGYIVTVSNGEETKTIKLLKEK